MQHSRAILLGLFACAVLSCSDDTNGTGSGNYSTGSTHTLLTDGPFPYDRVQAVDVYVLSVSASLSADTGATSGGNFVTLAEPHLLINLMQLNAGVTAELGATDLPAGAITAVRLTIDTDSSYIVLKDGRHVTATSTPGIQWQSSAGRPVLNALVLQQIQVPDSGADVVIDFDVGKAFIPNLELNPGSSDSGFIFSPVLRAVDANRSGAITGTAHAHTAGGATVADAAVRLYWGNPANNENTWSVIQSARTNAVGRFTLSFVTPTAWWHTNPLHANSSYIVAFDPPAAAGAARLVSAPVTVTVHDTTAMGTVVLP